MRDDDNQAEQVELDPAIVERVLNDSMVTTRTIIADSQTRVATVIAAQQPIQALMPPQFNFNFEPTPIDFSQLINEQKSSIEKVLQPSTSLFAEFLFRKNIFSEREILLQKRGAPMAPEYPNNNNDEDGMKSDHAKGNGL